jgi:predicted Zn-dependent protease
MDVSGAAQYYKNALEFQPDDPDANEGYRVVLLASDSPGDARKYLIRAVQLDPTNAAAYYHLSQASKKAGDLDGSKRELQESLRLKAQRDNLKHTFSDLPLEAARQNSKNQEGQDSSRKVP